MRGGQPLLEAIHRLVAEPIDVLVADVAGVTGDPLKLRRCAA